MLWNNLNHKRIGIWGMGKEGCSIQKAIHKYAHPTEIIEINEQNTSDIFSCDIIVKSPGVSLYRDEIKQAIQNGVIITSGTNLFFANKPSKSTIIAVTGTKGKSTTSSLLAHTLKTLGQNVVLGGNIGVPLVDLAETTADYIVAELSSYQCADFQGHADIAVLVNLYPEHLPWHGSHHQYYLDKINMINRASTAIINALDENTRKYRSYITTPDISEFDSEIHIYNNYFYDKETPLFPTSALQLNGEHNQHNGCAVLTVIKKLGFDLKLCEQAFNTFTPLPHRLQILGSWNELTFVDDSISTTPETAIAALEAFPFAKAITLLVGGEDRGQDYSELITYGVSHPHVRFIALPDTGERFAKTAVQTGLSVHMAKNMAEAVQTAFNMTPRGGLVLLSPAAPSYNLYRNFEERGQDFLNHIIALAK